MYTVYNFNNPYFRHIIMYRHIMTTFTRTIQYQDEIGDNRSSPVAWVKIFEVIAKMSQRNYVASLQNLSSGRVGGWWDKTGYMPWRIIWSVIAIILRCFSVCWETPLKGGSPSNFCSSDGERACSMWFASFPLSSPSIFSTPVHGSELLHRQIAWCIDFVAP